jgi:hypothetical protein
MFDRPAFLSAIENHFIRQQAKMVHGMMNGSGFAGGWLRNCFGKFLVQVFLSLVAMLSHRI